MIYGYNGSEVVFVDVNTLIIKRARLNGLKKVEIKQQIDLMALQKTQNMDPVLESSKLSIMRRVTESKMALGFENGQILIVDIPTETIVLRTEPLEGELYGISLYQHENKAVLVISVRSQQGIQSALFNLLERDEQGNFQQKWMPKLIQNAQFIDSSNQTKDKDSRWTKNNQFFTYSKTESTNKNGGKQEFINIVDLLLLCKNQKELYPILTANEDLEGQGSQEERDEQSQAQDSQNEQNLQAEDSQNDQHSQDVQSDYEDNESQNEQSQESEQSQNYSDQQDDEDKDNRTQFLFKDNSKKVIEKIVRTLEKTIECEFEYQENKNEWVDLKEHFNDEPELQAAIKIEIDNIEVQEVKITIRQGRMDQEEQSKAHTEFGLALFRDGKKIAFQQLKSKAFYGGIFDTTVVIKKNQRILRKLKLNDELRFFVKPGQSEIEEDFECRVEMVNLFFTFVESKQKQVDEDSIYSQKLKKEKQYPLLFLSNGKIIYYKEDKLIIYSKGNFDEYRILDGPKTGGSQVDVNVMKNNIVIFNIKMTNSIEMVDFNVEEPLVQQLAIIKCFGYSESFCGRFLTFVQYPPKVVVYDFSSMAVTLESSFDRPSYMPPILTSDHLVGVEHRGNVQFVCSFAQTEATTTLQGEQLLPIDNLHTILRSSDSSETIGIVSTSFCKKREIHDGTVLAFDLKNYDRFKPIDLLKQNQKPKMDKWGQEVEQYGLCLFNIVLHGSTLTWLVFENSNNKSNNEGVHFKVGNVTVYQCNLKEGSIKSIEIPIRSPTHPKTTHFSLKKDNSWGVLVIQGSVNSFYHIDFQTQKVQENWHDEIYKSDEMKKFERPKAQISLDCEMYDCAPFFTENKYTWFGHDPSEIKVQIENRPRVEVYDSRLNFSPDGQNLIYIDLNKPKYKFVKHSLKKKSIEQNSKSATSHYSNGKINQSRSLYHLEPEITLQWMTQNEFESMLYISNDLFMVPEKDHFKIFRVADGEPVCTLNNKDDQFEFLHNHYCMKMWREPEVTGILDKRTLKVYDVSIATLLHLGATGITIDVDDPIFKKDELFDQDQRLRILNKTVPASFFYELNDFQNKNAEGQLEAQKSQILQSIVVQKNGKVKFEVPLSYMCKKNKEDIVKAWLNPKLNYIRDKPSESPMSLMQISHLNSFRDWFYNIPKSVHLQVIGNSELIRMMPMPYALVRDIFEALWENKTQYMAYSIAAVKDNPVSSYEDKLEFITDKDVQKQVQEQLIEESPTGTPITIESTTIQLRNEVGTQKSIDFLERLEEYGETNPDVYKLKIIQEFINFKDKKLFKFKLAYFLRYVLFLVCVCFIPIETKIHTWILLFWTVFDIVVEYVQVRGKKLKFHEIFFSNFWNTLDTLRLLSQISYLAIQFGDDEKLNSARADLFCIVICLSWCCFLQYLRLFKTFRHLISMVRQCTTEIQPFLLVLSVLMIAFASPTYFRIRMMDEEDQKIHDILFGYYYMAFGDFSTLNDLSSQVVIILYGLGVFMIVLIMMNLLIGIISIKLDEVLQNAVTNNYHGLTCLIAEMETVMNSLCLTPKNAKEPKKYIVCAKYTFGDAQDEFEGRIKATTGPIIEEINDVKVDLLREVEKLSNQQQKDMSSNFNSQIKTQFSYQKNERETEKKQFETHMDDRIKRLEEKLTDLFEKKLEEQKNDNIELVELVERGQSKQYTLTEELSQGMELQEDSKKNTQKLAEIQNALNQLNATVKTLVNQQKE